LSLMDRWYWVVCGVVIYKHRTWCHVWWLLQAGRHAHVVLIHYGF
jgi:hypothetical protein